MNKNLDNLFEQARKSIKSEMPLEEVQQLIYNQASPSFWTNQKIWIMSTSILGVIAISTLFFLPSNQKNTSIVADKTPIITTPITKKNTATPPNEHLLKTRPDNLPLPIVLTTNNPNKEKIKVIDAPAIPIGYEIPTKLDSLGPKKTFTEYKLEIKKENSEQEIKKLKSELSNYGIHMEIKELSYNKENKIKRFKGQFKTDSLFCGSTMNDYEFDISGSFKSMEFIFRVADNKNLKYLKIQSDNFEETIECYDDEVISNTLEAKKISRQMQEEMMRAREEMANAQEEMARARKEMAIIRREEAFRRADSSAHHLSEYPSDIDWEKIEADIRKAMENVEVDFKELDEDVLESLQDLEVIILNKDFKKDMEILIEDLDLMRKDIEVQLRDQLQNNRYPHKLQNNRYPRQHRETLKTIRKTITKEQTKHELKTEIKALESEAEALERAAKKLRREAKKKAKAAKKKAKNN
ncbi:hypothetical protein [Aureispira anguillae]|uniref:Uncharacterized protein n=1 Tax=Aureispira anguillae TaxID=2864201 RepID=A0A916DXB7_9BACT|nr:hypothetical protein [Aureispira anguillae]BDS14921.1 hypothetical protein AsAng_0057030 [Aureispira anguillae]